MCGTVVLSGCSAKERYLLRARIPWGTVVFSWCQGMVFRVRVFLGVERSSFMVLWCAGMAFRARIPWGNGRLLRFALYRNWFLGWEFCTERLSSPSVVSRNDDCVLSRFCCNDAWQVAMASIKEKFWTLATTLQVVWLRVSVVLGCAGMSTMNFFRFEEFSDLSRMGVLRFSWS